MRRFHVGDVWIAVGAGELEGVSPVPGQEWAYQIVAEVITATPHSERWWIGFKIGVPMPSAVYAIDANGYVHTTTDDIIMRLARRSRRKTNFHVREGDQWGYYDIFGRTAQPPRSIPPGPTEPVDGPPTWAAVSH